MPDDEKPWWMEQGYLDCRKMGDDVYVVIIRMIFTFRVAICTENYVMKFWCYPLELGVSKAVWAMTEIASGRTAPEGYTREFPHDVKFIVMNRRGEIVAYNQATREHAEEEKRQSEEEFPEDGPYEVRPHHGQ